jgi:hypothetical protein
MGKIDELVANSLAMHQIRDAAAMLIRRGHGNAARRFRDALDKT